MSPCRLKLAKENLWDKITHGVCFCGYPERLRRGTTVLPKRTTLLKQQFLDSVTDLNERRQELRIESGFKVYRILPSGRLSNPMYLPHLGLEYKCGRLIEPFDLELKSHPTGPQKNRRAVHFYLNLEDAERNLRTWRDTWFYGPAVILNVEGPCLEIFEENGLVCVAKWIKWTGISIVIEENRTSSFFHDVLRPIRANEKNRLINPKQNPRPEKSLEEIRISGHVDDGMSGVNIYELKRQILSLRNCCYSLERAYSSLKGKFCALQEAYALSKQKLDCCRASYQHSKMKRQQAEDAYMKTKTTIIDIKAQIEKCENVFPKTNKKLRAGPKSSPKALW